MKLAAISVDLDEIGCYAAIYGLRPPGPSAARAIYDKALPRLAELFERERIAATFFAIGKDLDADNAARIADLHARGHEIASHSQSHYYDLTRRPREVMRDEVLRAQDAIERACGERPKGFRAPGYTINDALFDVLEQEKLLYDSSVFPCPAYWAAKATAIGAIRVRGRRSDSIVDDPRVLSAPADPYRVGRPYWRRGRGLVELPIGVTRGLRLPYYGSPVALAGERGARLLTQQIAGRPLVNLELHGIDLADADDDGLRWLAPYQVDLRRSAAAKRASIASAIATLRARGYRFVTLAEAARLVA